VIREPRDSTQVGSLGSRVTWQFETDEAWALEDADDSEDVAMIWEVVNDMTLKFEGLELFWDDIEMAEVEVGDDIEMAEVETDDMEVDS
jgi:hypothetical protein